MSVAALALTPLGRRFAIRQASRRPAIANPAYLSHLRDQYLDGANGRFAVNLTIGAIQILVGSSILAYADEAAQSGPARTIAEAISSVDGVYLVAFAALFAIVISVAVATDVKASRILESELPRLPTTHGKLPHLASRSRSFDDSPKAARMRLPAATWLNAVGYVYYVTSPLLQLFWAYFVLSAVTEHYTAWTGVVAFVVFWPIGAGQLLISGRRMRGPRARSHIMRTARLQGVLSVPSRVAHAAFVPISVALLAYSLDIFHGNVVLRPTSTGDIASAAQYLLFVLNAILNIVTLDLANAFGIDLGVDVASSVGWQFGLVYALLVVPISIGAVSFIVGTLRRERRSLRKEREQAIERIAPFRAPDFGIDGEHRSD